VAAALAALLGAVALPGTASAATPLWSRDFESGIGSWGGGAIQNASAVDSPSGSGKAMLVRAPGDNDGKTGRGVDVRPAITAVDEAWLKYRVFFPNDFDWWAGGKLPGLAGVSGGLASFSTSAGGTYDPRSWSGRILFIQEGRMKSYLYVTHAGGSDHAEYGLMSNWTTTLRKNTWHTIELHYKLNSPGQNNGLFEGYVDGVRGIRLADVQYRDATHPTLRINQLFFASFFGGPTSNQTDERWFFDDVVVSRTRS
jgi:hypothetical protein